LLFLSTSSQDGNTPLLRAVYSYYSPLATVKYLVAVGADVTIKNNVSIVYIICNDERENIVSDVCNMYFRDVCTCI